MTNTFGVDMPRRYQSRPKISSVTAWLTTPIFCLLFSLSSTAPAADRKWSGVDETVVEKFAEQAGHPARKPFINTDQGDLLLFCFLLAGTIGGFTAGYYFRTLFPPRVKPRKEPSDV